MPDNLQPQVKLEPMSASDDEQDPEKIGEIFRVNNHFSFLCAHCGEKFRLYIHFVAHIECHLQQILFSTSATVRDDKLEVNIEDEETKPVVHVDDADVRVAIDVANVFEAADAINATDGKVHNNDDDFFWSNNEEWDDDDDDEPPATSIKNETKIKAPPTDVVHTDQRFQCEMCSKYFQTSRILRKHMKLHANNNDIECPICGRKFAIEYYIKGHMWNVHKEREGYRCQKCDGRFENPHQFNVHKKTHRSSSPQMQRFYECHRCHATFDTLPKCFEHLDTVHWNPNVCKIQCERCKGMFASKLSLHKHLRSCGVARPNEFKCHVCPDEFPNNRQLVEHCRAAHPSGPRTFKCRKCGKEFSTKRKKKYHMECHRAEERIASNDLLKCPLCPREFSRSMTLKGHMTTHDKDATFECEICHKILRLRYKKQHMVRHENVKNYQCAQCGKKFVEISSLRAHMRWHSEDRTYQCEMCPKNYKTSFALKVHIESHTGNYTHWCGICKRGFSWRASLKKHSLSAHGKPLEDDAAVARFSVLVAKKDTES